MSISAKAPLRIDLAGGTIDIWPIWAMLGDAITINMAINLYSEIDISCTSEQQVLSDKSRDVPDLAKFIIDYYKSHYNFNGKINVKINTIYPERAGLAGSSSIIISLLSCLDNYFGIRRSYSETINFASNMEASFLKYPTGTQDYYPILYGGINAIHYHLEGIIHESIPLNGEIYNSFYTSLLLVKPNGFHNSANLNWSLLKDFIERKDNAIEQMKQINRASKIVYNAFKDDNINEFYKGIALDMEARKLLGYQIVPKSICDLIDELMESRIYCAKICGAGGSACIVLFCRDNASREQIAHGLYSRGIDTFKVAPQINGIEVFPDR